ADLVGAVAALVAGLGAGRRADAVAAERGGGRGAVRRRGARLLAGRVGGVEAEARGVEAGLHLLDRGAANLPLRGVARGAVAAGLGASVGRQADALVVDGAADL